MCGRFTLRTPVHQLVIQFQLGTAPELPPRFNIAPTQSIATLRTSGDTARQFSFSRWGLVPGWAKDLSIGNRLINARGETVAEKPSFRAAFKRRRCLIPADGYFEWKKIGQGKQPYYIRRADDQPFAFAGLWESWRGTEDEPRNPPVETCAIITTDSNEWTADIHDRMPVILEPDAYEMWLDPDLQQTAPLQPLLKPYDADELIVDPVSTHVNKATNDDPRCVEVQQELF